MFSIKEFTSNERKYKIELYKIDDILWFRAKQIAEMLGYKATKNVIRIHLRNEDIKTFDQLRDKLIDYTNKPRPKTGDYINDIFIKSQCIFTNLNGLKTILIKSTLPNSIDVAKFFNIDVSTIKRSFSEQESMHHIMGSFKNDKYERQYPVGKYRIDLYFIDYKIAIECDEFGHRDYSEEEEKIRTEFITKKLACTWIRFNPNDKNFDISTIINQIVNIRDDIRTKQNFVPINNIKTINIIKPNNFINKKNEIDLNDIDLSNIFKKETNSDDITLDNIEKLEDAEIVKKPKIKKLFKYKPTKEELIKDMSTMIYTEIATKYDVSVVTLIDWRKEYGFKDNMNKDTRPKDLNNKLNRCEKYNHYKGNNIECKICKKIEEYEKIIKNEIIDGNIKENKPTYEQIQKDLDRMPLIWTAKKYNVADETLIYWIKSYKKQLVKDQDINKSVELNESET